MADATLGAYNIADLREMARRRLPKSFFEFVDRGTEDEVGLRHNLAALAAIKFRPQVLVDVANRDLSIELFGQRQKLPFAISPTGIAGLLWHGGEVALARAAAAAGVPFSLATTSITSMEDVAAQAGGRLWYQLYMWPERKMSYEMVDRARAANFEALILTVDTVVSPNREYNQRNGYTAPFRFTPKNVADVALHPRWMFGTLARYMMNGGMPQFENYPEELRRKITSRQVDRRTLTNQSLTWDDLRDLRRMWPRKLIVKGILRADDAVRAVNCGADAVQISNHGGRNLDSAVAPIDVLPEILDAVGHRATVLVDSGYRRGSDIVKALALGAHAVMIGRGTLFGTAVAGQPGAARALAIYREEIDRTMAFLGCRTIADITPDILQLPPRPYAVAERAIASSFERVVPEPQMAK
jgi:isopentenyl diphosphate isomerase/L-lactate dehydrogenase-like FMN-dependent dehydrogenase